MGLAEEIEEIRPGIDFLSRNLLRLSFEKEHRRRKRLFRLARKGEPIARMILRSMGVTALLIGNEVRAI